MSHFAAGLKIVSSTRGDFSSIVERRNEPGDLVRYVRARKMSTVAGTMDEMSAALQFPYYFGENFDALDECIADLDWLMPFSHIVLGIVDAETILADEPARRGTMLKVLNGAVAEWREPSEYTRIADGISLPMTVLLHTTGSPEAVYESWNVSPRDVPVVVWR